MVDFPLEELFFCARYPYSERAKKIVKRLNPSLDELDSATKGLAKSILQKALIGKPYDVPFQDRESLKSAVIAYHVAKIMVSTLGNHKYYFYFSRSMQRGTLNFIEKSKKASAISPDIEELADDFGLKFYTKEMSGKTYFELSVVDFLSAPSKEESLKLINQNIFQGKIWLDENRFSRFLSEKAMSTVLSSLPVSSVATKEIQELAVEALKDSVISRKESSALGTDLQAMPPCMERLYSDLTSGNKLSHMENFALAAFLAAIGLSEEKILQAFSHAPNYDEKVARYHISRILRGKQGRNYLPLSCAKMQSYGFCIANCNVKNPLNYYRNALKSKGGAVGRT
ncbi:MAG: hypothetical protein N3F05_02555 [Candidatus Diapherotrites archaeon]|nr:hypothetical protein [Candidatus Diapherotrites archaeon]